MEKQNKSLLDKFQVKEEGFPLGKSFLCNEDKGVEHFEILSLCAWCNAPIYGKKRITATETNPTIIRSCNCIQTVK